jgi:membrane protein implicated in regulation of membrane protease activity
MEDLLTHGLNLILLLIEAAIILLLIDGIMSIICSMLGFSWKKVLMWAAAIFGLLWLRDFLKKRKEKKEEKEAIQELTEEDFETIED